MEGNSCNCDKYSNDGDYCYDDHGDADHGNGVDGKIAKMAMAVITVLI